VRIRSPNRIINTIKRQENLPTETQDEKKEEVYKHKISGISKTTTGCQMPKSRNSSKKKEVRSKRKPDDKNMKNLKQTQFRDNDKGNLKTKKKNDNIVGREPKMTCKNTSKEPGPITHKTMDTYTLHPTSLGRVGRYNAKMQYEEEAAKTPSAMCPARRAKSSCPNINMCNKSPKSSRVA
jgi:hypothetical protein